MSDQPRTTSAMDARVDGLKPAELGALRWLLTGAGRKVVGPKAPTGPHALEQSILVAVHRDLKRKGLVKIGDADRAGWRDVDITVAGRRAIETDNPVDVGTCTMCGVKIEDQVSFVGPFPWPFCTYECGRAYYEKDGGTDV